MLIGFFSSLILNVIFLGIIFFMRRRMAAVSQWPSTMGTVHASYLERRHSSSEVDQQIILLCNIPIR